jgi:hypothetical protein
MEERMVEAMKTPTPKFVPQVYRYVDTDNAHRVALVFRKGRTKYHAVVALHDKITLEAFAHLRGFVPLGHRGGEYPAKRAASFWLNRDHRPLTKRAKAVLKGLVARKPRGLTVDAQTGTVAA